MNVPANHGRVGAARWAHRARGVIAIVVLTQTFAHRLAGTPQPHAPRVDSRGAENGSDRADHIGDMAFTTLSRRSRPMGD